MTPRAALIWTAGTAAAFTTVWAAWVQLGGAIPASQLYVTQSDDKIKEVMTRGFRRVEAVGKKQTTESAKWGRKIYNKELHDLLVVPPPTDPEQKQYWHESIEDARKWRKYYSDKEIELRKK
jgi:hypothetical protein